MGLILTIGAENMFFLVRTIHRVIRTLCKKVALT